MHCLALGLALGCSPSHGDATDDDGGGPAETVVATDGPWDDGRGSEGEVIDPDASDYGCDLHTQDCLDGLKCAPIHDDDRGGDWLLEGICVPVVDDAAGVGEPCSYLGQQRYSGYDDCAWASYCTELDESGEGVCRAMCLDDPDSGYWFCLDSDEVCVAGGQDDFGTCYARCDPRVGCVEPNRVCILAWNPVYDGACVPDWREDDLPAGEPCSSDAECDVGLACWDSVCTPYCTVGDGTCVLPATCVALLESVEQHPILEGIGLCMAP